MEAFVCICEGGSFNAAARRLNVTQPTVSQRVRELESAIDARLFERNGPRIRLTAEGKALEDLARNLMRSADDVAAHFQTSNQFKGVLRLGVSRALAFQGMSELLQLLEVRFPLLKVSLRVDDSGSMSKMLADGDLDVAVLRDPAPNPLMEQKFVAMSELVWFGSARRSWPRRMRPQDLAALHVFLSPPPSRLHASVMGWFAAANAVPSRISTCNDPVVSIESAASGLSVSALPRSIVRESINSGRLVELSVQPALPSHQVFVCYVRDKADAGMEAISEVTIGVMKRLGAY
ncbi:LysR family transcriptional regulator [Hydrogenophaga sp.]|uniref:LysR family transcriptional regulator n=1 Tax=Hydrogenophaga sp. TaxID=1904254 RepID=UPI002715CB45|nr:LysR family transcriptional regulator [Hydrogenophaga sp.]MDO9436679.1 LysR family transcriptional regulator [Hydrogenophaga sp.]